MHQYQNVNSEGEDVDHVVSLVLKDLLNKAILPNSSVPIATHQDPTPSTCASNSTKTPRRTTTPQVAKVHSRQNEVIPTYEIYRAMQQFAESQSDLEVGAPCINQAEGEPRNRFLPILPPPMPPSYSTVIKQGRPSLDIRRDVRSMETQHISPFTRAPPPSYAEVQGVWSRDFSNTSSSEQVLLGPDPIYIWCSHCATVVITVTQAQRSKFTHLTAAALCLFGCWPCAMLPYFMNSCKNIYHYCPDCNYLFGMYRPW